MRKLEKALKSKSCNWSHFLEHYGLILLLLSLSMVIFLSGCGAQDTYIKHDSSQSQIKQTATSAPGSIHKVYVVGETFRIGDLQYKLNSVKTSNEEGVKPPKSGNTFLLLDLTIENHGTADVEVRSMIGFKLYDQDGRSQAFSMNAAQAVKCAMDGTIIAGGKMTGELGYEVSMEVQTFTLKISPNPFSSKTAIIEIPINSLPFETI